MKESDGALSDKNYELRGGLRSQTSLLLASEMNHECCVVKKYKNLTRKNLDKHTKQDYEER